jgi:2-polyprenyl-6-methoxyphenol hydroxylase-like FAD-dependent oxidoreductase
VRVTILGGGLTGLLAGLLLGRRGHAVTVVERDEAPPSDGPEAVFEHWARRGLPQARQPHMFLGRSVRVLRDEAPDVLDDLLAAGVLALPVDLGDGPGDAVICSRRLPYEAVLRRAAGVQPGVTIRAGAGVNDLVFDRHDRSRVRGTQLDNGVELSSDLVVDATGRRSPTPRILAGHGFRPLPEVAQDCGLLYVSRHYRLRRGADYPDVDVPIMANLGWAAAMAFPGDRETFCLLAVVASIDPLRKDLASDEGFARFHRAIPLTSTWLEAGEPISEIRTMARVENRYRRLVDESGPIATGMLVVGDAAMHTNPTAGRGVSLAFAHVQRLASTIDGAGSPAELAVAFDAWTDANIAAWYQLQAGADASISRRMHAAVRGETLPPPDRTEQIRQVLIEASKQPGPEAQRLRRLRNVIELPADVLADPAVLAAADDFLARRPERNGQLPGPTREAFLSGAPSCPVGDLRWRTAASS